MFGALLARARQLGYKRLLGEYIPTNKNQLVADLYDRMGFERIAEHDGGRIGYALELADAAAPTTFIQPAEAAHR
jgi:predicted enzyme involved in methoxymalonyl-ACP biosynthesis